MLGVSGDADADDDGEAERVKAEKPAKRKVRRTSVVNPMDADFDDRCDQGERVCVYMIIYACTCVSMCVSVCIYTQTLYIYHKDT